MRARFAAVSDGSDRRVYPAGSAGARVLRDSSFRNRLAGRPIDILAWIKWIVMGPTLARVGLFGFAYGMDVAHHRW